MKKILILFMVFGCFGCFGAFAEQKEFTPLTIYLQTCTKNLAGITDQMNRLQEAIRIYNEAILAYSDYEETSQNKF